MSDNVTLDPGSGGASVATDELTYSGDTAQVPISRVVHVTGSEGAKTLHEVFFAEDAAHTTGDYGLQFLAVRNDTLAALAGTDGDYAPLQVSATGALYVEADLGANNDVTIDNSSIVKAEDAVHNSGDAGVMSLAVRNDALAALAGTDGDYAPLQVNASGALYVAVDSGTVTANLSATDNAVLDTIASNTTNLANCIIQDDAPFTPATGYLMMVGGEHDDSGPDSVDEGDAGNFRISANRSLYVQLRDAAGNERGLNVDASGDIGVTTALDATVAGNELQVDVVGSFPAGANLIGDVGIQGRTTGGLTPYWNADLDETAVAVKAGAGTVYALHVINLTAAPLYLQFFDVAQGSVTVGSTTPTFQLPIPANADSDGAGFTISVPQGIAFATAITAAATTDSAGNGAPSAGACHVNLFYK